MVNNIPKITNFDLSIFANDKEELSRYREVSDYNINNTYIAPEMTLLSKESYDYRVDIFSMGRIMKEVLKGERLHASINDAMNGCILNQDERPTIQEIYTILNNIYPPPCILEYGSGDISKYKIGKQFNDVGIIKNIISNNPNKKNSSGKIYVQPFSENTNLSKYKSQIPIPQIM